MTVRVGVAATAHRSPWSGSLHLSPPVPAPPHASYIQLLHSFSLSLSLHFFFHPPPPSVCRSMSSSLSSPRLLHTPTTVFQRFLIPSSVSVLRRFCSLTHLFLGLHFLLFRSYSSPSASDFLVLLLPCSYYTCVFLAFLFNCFP